MLSKSARLAAAVVTLVGGLSLMTEPAHAASLDPCSDSDWDVAIDQANASCAAEDASTVRMYSCEYHPDSGYIVWEYSCLMT